MHAMSATRFVLLPILLLMPVTFLLASESVLPPSGFEGWKLDGKPRTYAGEALYDHIDGGAEVFLELGFESCEYRRFSRGKMEFGAEWYRMADRAAALGIYLMQCGKETPDPGFSERHTASENQLTFLKGRDLVRLTGKPGACPKRDLFLKFAGYAAERIPTLPEPEILGVLPREGRVEGTLRILRGPVTLSALAPPFSADLLPLGRDRTAVAADYKNESGRLLTRLVVLFPDVSEAKRVLETFAKGAGATASVPPGEGSAAEAGIAFRGPSGHGGNARVEGASLAVQWGPEIPH
jgi:hypothetical protein